MALLKFVLAVVACTMLLSPVLCDKYEKTDDTTTEDTTYHEERVSVHPHDVFYYSKHAADIHKHGYYGSHDGLDYAHGHGGYGHGGYGHGGYGHGDHGHSYNPYGNGYGHGHTSTHATSYGHGSYGTTNHHGSSYDSHAHGYGHDSHGYGHDSHGYGHDSHGYDSHGLHGGSAYDSHGHGSYGHNSHSHGGGYHQPIHKATVYDDSTTSDDEYETPKKADDHH